MATAATLVVLTMAMEGVVATVLDEQLATAIDTQFDRGPHPSALELLRHARSTGSPVRATIVRDGPGLAAAALCVVESARVYGIPVRAYRMAGGRLHDYVRLYHRDAHTFVRLLGEIESDARASRADVIVLDNILGVEACPCLARWHSTEMTTKIFDADIASKGWSDIYGKKSVSQALKKVRKAPGYRASHVIGEFDEADLSELAALHIERRRFDGETSAFERPQRRKEYLAERANKLLTSVWLGSELLCAHYGMVYGDLLLLHTTAINVKYLGLSPLQVLLAETAQYCESAGLRYLDLGLGDETYKSRFGNSTRELTSFFLSVSPRGQLVDLSRVANAGPRLRAFAEGAGRLGRRVRQSVSPLTRDIAWFEHVNDASLQGTLSGGQELVLLESFERFSDDCRQGGHDLRRWQYERYRRGAVSVGLRDHAGRLCSGWFQYRGWYPLPTGTGSLNCDECAILHDYRALRAGDGSDPLPVLADRLQSIVSGQRLVAHARRHDRRAIAKLMEAGFRPILEPMPIVESAAVADPDS